MQLKNKIALITGASSGIGRETAKLFAKEGALVILTARHLDRLKEVQKEIENNNGKAESYSMDITNREQLKDTIKKIVDKHKKIDILVNSAGIVVWGSIENTAYKDFDEQVLFNLTGTFNTIKEIAPIMINQKSGHIINIITTIK